MAATIWNKALDLLGRGLDEPDYDYQAAPAYADDEQGDEGVYPIQPEQRATATCPLVRAEPRNMDEATAVADEIKRRAPVILNLEECNPEEARRIRDFLGGVTYGLNGYMKKLGTWVYACSPFDMPVERLVLDGPNVGEPRYERDDTRDDEPY